MTSVVTGPPAVAMGRRSSGTGQDAERSELRDEGPDDGSVEVDAVAGGPPPELTPDPCPAVVEGEDAACLRVVDHDPVADSDGRDAGATGVAGREDRDLEGRRRSAPEQR